MGRPLKERGSQKTCLNEWEKPSRIRVSPRILRIKKGNPRIDSIRSGDFFWAESYKRRFYFYNKLEEKTKDGEQY